MVSNHSACHNESMIDVEDALSKILSVFSTLSIRDANILEANGMVLAQDVISEINIPPLDNSAMDGYAIKHEDVNDATPKNPKTLRVVATTAAGDLPYSTLLNNESVRIMTGAPVPIGATSVIPFEDTSDNFKDKTSSDKNVLIYTNSETGKNVRKAGQDVTSGEIVLKSGTELHASHIALIASLGKAKVKVFRRPEVAILATGNEISEPGSSLNKGQIYDSNSYGIAAAVKEAGGNPSILGIAKDDFHSIEEKLNMCNKSDFVITSAGVSKGDFDIVKDVLSKNGSIEFHSVRMKPGKPLAFGMLQHNNKHIPLVGLPGNPVSALVAFEQFCRPAIRLMLGNKFSPRATIKAILDDEIRNPDGRRIYARAIVYKKNDVYHASLSGVQSSNILSAMAKANGLAICPENKSSVQPGEEVAVMMLYWPSEVF
ncbi:MAG: molybdopterin molybdenumtransferase MoeA [Dehalococcoidia bacterium]|nr:molybdopterin molybdenumtransferase MoeA [Dehalococcoidia bacterium]MQG15996.1 molybdopterin molybdotransferase MoeA [SAR202 cluster bacterium]